MMSKSRGMGEVHEIQSVFSKGSETRGREGSKNNPDIRTSFMDVIVPYHHDTAMTH